MKSFEIFLQERLDSLIVSRTRQAVEYSLMAGGKRVRPALLFQVLEFYHKDKEWGFWAAAALEMIHTYSLIHDDLPAMDDDDLRRGKPTCHIAFDEAQALLAGDALQPLAFQILTDSPYSDHQVRLLIRALSKACGIEGMVYGQELDLKGNQSDQELIVLQQKKTGALLGFAMEAGAILSGHEKDASEWKEIGILIGIQFQQVDDVLDIISDEETMQKSLSDLKNGKTTFHLRYGLSKALEQIDQLAEEIQTRILKLQHEPGQADALLNYLQDLKKRSS